MRFTRNGLTLWFGERDTPAPVDVEADRSETAVTVAVEPALPHCAVTVRYRVDGGVPRSLRATLQRTDHARRRHYFQATFPALADGEVVEYGVVCRCAGNQVPDPHAAAGFPASFRLGPRAAPRLAAHPERGATERRTAARRGDFGFDLEYLCRIAVQIERGPELLGVTPEGLKVDWYLAGGTVTGPRLNARVRSDGGDWLTIRPDGIAILDVRATLETADGALIFLAYTGLLDLGPTGYEDFLRGRTPQRPPLRSAPRFITSHPAYVWLNRLQCIAVGEVCVPELACIYDLYALR